MPSARAALFETFVPRIEAVADEHRLPGTIVGVIASGALIWVHGHGETRLGNAAPPDVDSVFRIASMTKSFTAAAILLLRDRGALRLDDPIAAYLPWTASIGAPDGAAPIAIRDLLTMNAGFPTDDPWGDRHEPTPIPAFDALVGGGFSFTHAPGTGFTYSNLGYALLGRVVSEAAGVDYREFVARELLAPLGMDATCFAAWDVDDRRRAHGYAVRDGERIPEPLVAPGAFSPMGGLHSSVRDLTAWVRGFALPSAEPHPLKPASRREMQQGRTHTGTTLVPANGTSPAKTITSLYAYGLVVDVDSTLGRFVHHSGGYPGFGSHMRWHPASGYGIVALANRTYAPMRPLAAALLDDIVAQLWTPPDVLTTLWPATRDAMDLAEALVDGWDDAVAGVHFAANVDLDLPRAERRAAFARAAARLGHFRRDRATLTSTSPAHVAWTVRGERGDAAFELLMTPERPPRIQHLSVEIVEPEDGAGG